MKYTSFLAFSDMFQILPLRLGLGEKGPGLIIIANLEETFNTSLPAFCIEYNALNKSGTTFSKEHPLQV